MLRLIYGAVIICAVPRDWCSQVVWFKSSPHTTHNPLQSGRHNGLIGISSTRYSRTIGPRSIFPSSGRIKPESVIVRELKANNSLNFVLRGCWRSVRQRTHWPSILAWNCPWTIKPCGVRPILATPEKSIKSRSGWRWMVGKSKWKSRL